MSPLYFIRHQGNANKNNNEITTHLLEWPKSEHHDYQKPEKTWSNRNSHSPLVGMQNGIGTWWFLKKLNMLLPYNPSIVLLGIYQINGKFMST